MKQDKSKNWIHFSKITLILMMTSFSIMAKEGVILLHGLARTSKSMNKMEKHLREAGFETLNVDYESRKNTIDSLSARVISKSLIKMDSMNVSTIHFVTHSLGGILVRNYMSKNNISNMGRVVMLGPPNQGSEVVDKLKNFSFFKKLNGPAGGQLGTDATSKPNTLGKVNFELGIIAGDRSIIWINSSYIKGSDDGKVSVEKTKIPGMKDHVVIHTTHPMMMKNNHVIEQVIEFLKKGKFKKDKNG